ncbi:MAG: zinc ribbon domain-containing protein [Clostridiales Family XIII bacterium]|jgi:hypothetical protein|nr:zinc ribbon domain-containing protein [Clostridiales Family XIII bacterium]
MNCPKCSSYVSDNTRFCAHCGYDIVKGGGIYGVRKKATDTAKAAKEVTRKVTTFPDRLSDKMEAWADNAGIVPTADTVPPASQYQTAQPETGPAAFIATPIDTDSSQVAYPVRAKREWNKVVIGILIAALPILFGVFASLSDDSDDWDYEDDEVWYEEPVEYSDYISTLSLPDWSEYDYSEAPGTSHQYLDPYDESVLYVLAGYDADNDIGFVPGGAVLNDDMADPEKTEALLQNAFAPLNYHLSTEIYTLGPYDVEVEGSFDFEITPGTLLIEHQDNMTILSCHYTLRNNDEVSGTFYLIRKDNTPYGIPLYSVINPYADIEAVRQNTLADLSYGSIIWHV